MIICVALELRAHNRLFPLCNNGIDYLELAKKMFMEVERLKRSTNSQQSFPLLQEMTAGVYFVLSEDSSADSINSVTLQQWWRRCEAILLPGIEPTSCVALPKGEEMMECSRVSLILLYICSAPC